jgi:hypothetical protein
MLTMKYLITVTVDDEEVMHCATVPEKNAWYVRTHIIPRLRPLTDEEYMTGPAVVLQTFARSSYILHGVDLLWCVEWAPGLMVLRFSPDGSLAWTGLRSPVPNFAGREPMQEDIDAYDEDAENYQYNLVFNPWDAQFSDDDRESDGYAPADEATQRAYEAAVEHVDKLGEVMEARFSENRDAWAADCKRNLDQWLGEGIRVDVG